MLQQQRIAQTIVKLQQAGKRMPQDIRPGFDRLEEAKRILSETVNLWAGIFNQQNIGLDRWEKAEQIALTLTGANGLNVNIISPALMQAALKQAEEAHVQENINRCNMEKLSQSTPTPKGIAEVLLKWTRMRMAKHHPISSQDMPQSKAVFEYGRQIGLSDNAIDSQFRILQCYMNDFAYSCKHHEPCKSKLLKCGDVLTLEVLA
jgi:hypothetical protein